MGSVVSAGSGSQGDSSLGLSSGYVLRMYTFIHTIIHELTSCNIALVLVFTVPRVPGFSVNSLQPLAPATKPFNEGIPVEFSRAPANFSFPGEMQLQADTGGNFLPLTFNNIHGTIYDLQTTRQVAQGDTGKLTVPAKQLPIVTLPLNFSYVATNDSDQTCKPIRFFLMEQLSFCTAGSNWYNGCRNKGAYADNKRPCMY